MLQLCGCYSASPYPLDTGLVRLIVYLAFRATQNAFGPRHASLSSWMGILSAGPERVWIAEFT